jgi:hypothetical protein
VTRNDSGVFQQMDWEVQMKRQIFALISAIALGLSVQGVSAAPISFGGVPGVLPGTLSDTVYIPKFATIVSSTDKTPDRENPVAGFLPGGDIFELGTNGTVAYVFDEMFGAAGLFQTGGVLTVTEKTNPPLENWQEFANVFVGEWLTGTFVQIGGIFNADAQNGFQILVPSFDLSLNYDSFLFRDVPIDSCNVYPACSFDLDGVSFQRFEEQVSQVPVPGSLALMGLGLLGLGLSQRRKLS